MELASRIWENPWVESAVIVAAAIAVALLIHWLVFLIIERAMPLRLAVVRQALIRRTRRPTRFIAPFLGLLAVLPALPLPDRILKPLDYVSGLGIIALVGWACIVALALLEDIVTSHYRVDVRDNLRARQIKTQSQLLRRVASFVIIVVTASLMLMSVPEVRHLGVSLFASAGVAGIVIGMAARPALANLIAGLQVALTEPIRIDDVVIVEGEFGWVEEIGTSFVTVRIWDLRRMVVPLSYFMEKPFQNWTRVSAELLGTVFLHTDYAAPLDAMRAELDRILDATELWDKKVKVIQVTDASEKTMELRVLVSAQDAPTLWDLRVLVREKLIEWLQKNHPESLPRDRQENLDNGHRREAGSREDKAAAERAQPPLPFTH